MSMHGQLQDKWIQLPIKKFRGGSHFQTVSSCWSRRSIESYTEALVNLQKKWQIDENLAKVLKEHQWEGIRHMWHNVVIGIPKVYQATVTMPTSQFLLLTACDVSAST